MFATCFLFTKKIYVLVLNEFPIQKQNEYVSNFPY